MVLNYGSYGNYVTYGTGVLHYATTALPVQSVVAAPARPQAMVSAPPPPPPPSRGEAASATLQAASAAATQSVLPAPQFATSPFTWGVGGKIWIGDLPPEVSREELRQAFAPFGNIVDLNIVSGRAHLTNRSYGIIQYSDPAVASHAVSVMNGKYEFRAGDGPIIVRLKEENWKPRQGVRATPY